MIKIPHQYPNVNLLDFPTFNVCEENPSFSLHHEHGMNIFFINVLQYLLYPISSWTNFEQGMGNLVKEYVPVLCQQDLSPLNDKDTTDSFECNILWLFDCDSVAKHDFILQVRKLVFQDYTVWISQSEYKFGIGGKSRLCDIHWRLQFYSWHWHSNKIIAKFV